jgi:hypothetical protein
VVLGLVVTEIELVGSVGELGELGELDEEVGVMVPPVLEREDGSLVVEGGGGEAVVPDEDVMVSVKLRGTPVPVTDVAGALEAGVPVEDVKGGLFGRSRKAATRRANGRTRGHGRAHGNGNRNCRCRRTVIGGRCRGRGREAEERNGRMPANYTQTLTMKKS